MKKFRLMMMAGLMAFAASANAQKVVISAENCLIGEDGTGELVLNLTYPTEESVAGYNFSLTLPEGIVAGTKTGKMTAAAFTLSDEIHPKLYNPATDDYDAAPLSVLKVQDKAGGGYLIIWIDMNEQTPLLKTEGQLMTIKIKAEEGFVSGEANITGVGVTSTTSVSLDLGNIADSSCTIQFGSENGINDIQAADATAPAYNLQGVRVNGDAKGIIIRDGKKMVVK